MIRQLLIAALVGVALSAPQADKIDSALLAKLRTKQIVNVVFEFQPTRAVLDRVESMRFESRGAKTTEMKRQLEAFAESQQRSALSVLSGRANKFQSFWISNNIIAEVATLEEVEKIAALPEVTKVYEEIIVELEPIREESGINAEWGIDKIEATQAWALPGGNNGAGVVVSAIDTGARYTHEALASNYRSSYGWFDPYSGSANPIDQNGHGTHVMGTIAGSMDIGVAPGSSWIACRGCDTSSCTQAALTACGQWVACPTLANGQSPDCNQTPDVCSNSWGGGSGQTWFRTIVESWHTAGIIPVFALGNSGPSCGTANSPGDMDNVIGVGATDNTDTVASFSSRGPAGGNRVKPEVSAPGVNVRSSWYTSDTAYNSISGTSMATPHVSGNVALLLSRNPNFTYQQIKDLLQNNADREMGNAATCGGTPPTQWPNNIYGHGRINARRNLAAAIGFTQ